MRVINDAYRRAARILSPDISRTYVEHLAYKAAKPEDGEEFEDAILEGQVSVAALGLLMEVQAYFDAEADKLAKEWFSKYDVAIKTLPDDRKEAYRQIREMSAEPQDVNLVKPEERPESTEARLNGQDVKLPTYKQHLLCDESGDYPFDSQNSWEAAVLEAELKREGFSFWYRNPQQPGQSSLGIAYAVGPEYKVVRHDFIFFSTLNGGKVVSDVVDPHGHHFADALPKLQGLAVYAAAHATAYRRIESVAEVKGKLRVLDLTREDVRQEPYVPGVGTAAWPAINASNFQRTKFRRRSA
jgi:type III restriction enzyme